MELPTSARSAERSSKKTSRRRPPRNQHNRPKKKSHHVEVVTKVLLVGSKGPLEVLAVPRELLVDPLVGLRVLPVNQAGHLEGAEHGEPSKAQRQRKREHRIDKRVVGNEKGL
jgi:hypothetical protein